MVPPKMRHWGPSEDAAPALSRKSSVPAILAAGASDRKSTRLNSSHLVISYAVFCLKKKPSNIGISQSTFSVKVLNLFSRRRRNTNTRKSKHSAMLRNKETRHRMFIEIGRAVQQECRDRYRMPSSA